MVSLSKLNNILLCGVLVVVVLFYCKAILIPVTYAILFAMLMTKVANFLESKGLGRILSTIICLLIMILIIAGVMSLIAIQITKLSEQIGTMQDKVDQLIHQIQGWVENTLNISSERQTSIIKKQSQTASGGVSGYFKSIITGITTSIFDFFLILFLTALFLLKREKYENFFLMIYKGPNPDEARNTIQKISKVAQKYLWGRFVSIIILTFMYWIGLMVVGLKNAFLLSAIAALMTIIPYVGPVLGGMFPFSMAIVTEQSFGPALGVAMTIFIVQTIDNYFIEPYIVGGEVNINATFTVIILIIGSMIWGISGVILFLPLMGVVKIIFENIHQLQPIGYLIGDDGGQSPVKQAWNKVSSKFKKK